MRSAHRDAITTPAAASETTAASARSICCVSNEKRMFSWAQSSSSSDQKRKTEGERDRERERGRQSETETERETERERYSERHRERDRDRQRVCVFLTQSSLPGSSVCVTPWTVAHQAPLSKGFPRQENWSGWPFPPLGDLLDPGIETTSPEFPSIGRGNLYHCTTWEAPKDNCWQLSR